MNARPSRKPLLVSFWWNWSLAVLAGAVLPGMVVSATGTPGVEPFPDWPTYFVTWCFFTLIFSIFPYPFGLLPAVAPVIFRRPAYRFAVSASFARVWLLAPLVAAWCAAELVDASYSPGFQGPRSTGPLPARWQPIAAFLSSDWWLLLFVALGAGIVVLKFRPELNRWRRHFADQCEHCGYSVAGLPSTTCPECGHERSAWNGIRPL